MTSLAVQHPVAVGIIVASCPAPCEGVGPLDVTASIWWSEGGRRGGIQPLAEWSAGLDLDISLELSRGDVLMSALRPGIGTDDDELLGSALLPAGGAVVWCEGWQDTLRAHVARAVIEAAVTPRRELPDWLRTWRSGCSTAVLDLCDSRTWDDGIHVVDVVRDDMPGAAQLRVHRDREEWFPAGITRRAVPQAVPADLRPWLERVTEEVRRLR